MKYVFPIVMFILVSRMDTIAQDFPEHATGKRNEKGEMLYRYIEVMPYPKYDISRFLSQNIRYPDSARSADIEGRITVNFVVDSTGYIRDAKIVGDQRLGYGLEEEALRVILSMPDWVPGTQNGRPVNVYYTIPIRFKLEGRKKKRKR